MNARLLSLGFAFGAAMICVVLVGCSKASQASQDVQAPSTKAPTAQDGLPERRVDVPVNTVGAIVDFTNDRGQLVCPVTGDVIADKNRAASHADFEGKRYYFCCASCPPMFKQNPSKYADGRAIQSGQTLDEHDMDDGKQGGADPG